MSEAPAVIVVDDHLLLVETLVLALRSDGVPAGGLRPQPGTDALQQLLVLRPALVLLDLDLGDYGNSTSMIRPLTAAGIRVLIVTGLPDRLRIAVALELGAVGYQSKADGFEALVDAAKWALTTSHSRLNGDEAATLLQELHAARAADEAGIRVFHRLTDRERDALTALCDGLTVRQIAQLWVVSEATVRSHVQRILTKLEVVSQVQAVVLALRSNWAGAAVTRFSG